MTWLDNTVKSNELVGHYDEESLNTQYSSNKYFEVDDNTVGVDIDGYLFFPKSVNGNESFSHREFIRTKIMSGGEFVSRGQYIPKEFSFDTIIDIEPEHLDDYLSIFEMMENKVCRVTSPYMGGMFNAEVKIDVTNPESSPHIIECTVTIKEIAGAMARLKGDPVIQYPSITTIDDINVKERTTKDEKKDVNNGHVDIYDSDNSSNSSNY